VPHLGSVEGEAKVMTLYLAQSIIRFNSDSVTSNADVPDKENMGLGRADGLISSEMKRRG